MTLQYKAWMKTFIRKEVGVVGLPYRYQVQCLHPSQPRSRSGNGRHAGGTKVIPQAAEPDLDNIVCRLQGHKLRVVYVLKVSMQSDCMWTACNIDAAPIHIRPQAGKCSCHKGGVYDSS